MTTQDLDQIEKELNLTLPSEFRSIAGSRIFQDPIHDEAQPIFKITQSFRTGEFGDENWPNDLVAFGHDGCGNYFCFYASNFVSGIFIRDHETLEVIKEYVSFGKFLEEWS